jgi:hypothetical protein
MPGGARLGVLEIQEGGDLGDPDREPGARDGGRLSLGKDGAPHLPGLSGGTRVARKLADEGVIESRRPLKQSHWIALTVDAVAGGPYGNSEPIQSEKIAPRRRPERGAAPISPESR